MNDEESYNESMEKLTKSIVDIIRESENSGEVPRGINAYVVLAHGDKKGLFRVAHGHVSILESMLEFALGAHRMTNSKALEYHRALVESKIN